MKEILNSLSVCILPAIILIILISAFVKRVPAYEAFTEGAKEGFWVSIKIIPYLVAIMAAVAMFRASGAIEWLTGALQNTLEFYKIPVDTLPLMLTRSLSGGATLGVFSDIVMQTVQIHTQQSLRLSSQEVLKLHFMFYLFILAPLGLKNSAMQC